MVQRGLEAEAAALYLRLTPRSSPSLPQTASSSSAREEEDGDGEQRVHGDERAEIRGARGVASSIGYKELLPLLLLLHAKMNSKTEGVEAVVAKKRRKIKRSQSSCDDKGGSVTTGANADEHNDTNNDDDNDDSDDNIYVEKIRNECILKVQYRIIMLSSPLPLPQSPSLLLLYRFVKRIIVT